MFSKFRIIPLCLAAIILSPASPSVARDKDTVFFESVAGEWKGPGEIVAGKYKGTKFVCNLSGDPVQGSAAGISLDGHCRVGVFNQKMSALITRKGNPAELDSNDLCGEKIAVVGGSTQVELVVPALDKACESEGKPPIETIRFPESSDAPAAVASGRADGALIPSPQALYLASIQPDNFEVPDFVHLGQSYSGMTVPKGSDLVAPLEAALNALIESGVYGEILEKWNMSALAVPNAIINGASERQ